MSDQQAHNPCAQKAIRLVDYLLKLAALRTKVIRDVGEYEKTLWISSIPHERECFTQAWGRDEEHEKDEWIEVRNRREPEVPAVPTACKDWVNPSALWNKNDLPELAPQITRQIQNPDWCEGSDQPETIPHSERLEDHPEIQRAWERYVEEKWLPWTGEHNAWKKVQEVYSALFAIHQEQLRLGEEFELVLGLGLLTWQTPSGQRARRHLVVADAILEFEARMGRFTVRPHTEGAKLRPELDMLDIEEQPARAEEAAKASLNTAEDDPWEKAHVEGVLQALVHSIDSQGDYQDSLETKNTRASLKPIVEYAPALVLRKRSAKGLSETLKRIKEQIENGDVIPGEFADLAEIRPKDGHESTEEPEQTDAVFDGEVFFPKPSNDEQRRIVEKMRASSGVLVQGPPGTGKSHTIANLICHLLATGNRILVTAKTPRALQVLLGKSPRGESEGSRDDETGDRKQEGLIPDEIKPLCISLLGSGSDERNSLESSVKGILGRFEDWSESRAIQDREVLEKNLCELREQKAQVYRRLRDIRESETHTQSVAEGCYRGTAARIAEAVNRNRADLEWFTDSVPLEKTCPIDMSELRSVLVALRRFTPEKRHELCLARPEAMLSAERFANIVSEELDAAEEERKSADGASEVLADLLARADISDIEAIRHTCFTYLEIHRKLLSTSHSWMVDAVRDIVGGNSSLWRELQRVTHGVITSIDDLVALADEAHLEFPNTADLRLLYEDACKLKEHVENDGKLGWGIFRPKAVRERIYVIKSVKLGGRPCSEVKHFASLADALHVRLQCEKAWGFWKGRGDQVEGPYALQLTSFKGLHEALERAFALENLIGQCRESLKKYPGMPEPEWGDVSRVERIVSSCRLALARIRKRAANEEIQKVEVPIARIAASGSAHPMTHELLRAVCGRDVNMFERSVRAIEDLETQHRDLENLDERLSNLHRLFPQLTEALERTCNEHFWNDRVQRIGDAWHWRQARHWIEEYIRQEDVPALAKRSKQIEDEVNRIVAKLASLHAWSFCFSRLKENHRRHMGAWQLSMKRLGKGTGKHAPRHRREAQEHLNECREAVPAWVMPLHRVWDTVHPAPGMFDVIIVDEASQCGVEALPLFYLGKRILIVGDDKQISPDAVGLPRDSVHRLMEEFLHDFEFKSSFDIESSLFDHGKLRYGTRQITLREHFRCMPEIIRFSNDLCYSDTPLIPLRQYGPNRLPPLEHVLVSGGYREGSNHRTINRPEAEAVVARIAEMCGDSRYNDKTMGVVVLQGEAQAALIENLLLERLGAEEMERRRLVCGNPYSFQGDERDIIFLSLVAANNEKIGTLNRAADERRFNVAASRARDMMVLFHSVTSNDLSASCLRKRLLDFFENTKPQQIAGIDREELERRAAQDNRSLVKPPPPFESWFEVDVALEVVRKGFTLLAQYEIAGKRIDLVVEGGQARLAVECDGDHWHGADRHEEDMQRQRQLERCGWEFFRVRESAFYANSENALADLWRMLEERGIFPYSQNSQAKEQTGEADHGENTGESNGDTDDFESTGDSGFSSEDSEGETLSSGRRADEVTAGEIRVAILKALSLCPNYSCTLHSLAARVLREVGVLTRGKPREAFERRAMRCVSDLEKDGRVKTYRAKNRRLRLVRDGNEPAT